jgi:hypothetical protein
VRIVLAIVLVFAATAVCVAIVDRAQIPPRRLGPYLEHRAAGHRPSIENAGHRLREWLVAADRGVPVVHRPLPVPDLAFEALPSARRTVTVASADALRRAIAEAQPGDTIMLMPGTYRFQGPSIAVVRAGSATDPIVVRAGIPGSVELEFDLLEGFHVLAPYWVFEDLVIRGVCADHSACEHAFHVVGNAEHFDARRNVVLDFNAHFKINGLRGEYPDFGRIEGNVLTNSRIRDTGNPVTPIDLVAASHWRVTGNRISDFIKAGSNQVSYGAFAKGGGRDNVFERNVVVCEDKLRGAPGQRVGLSLGGGGTGAGACRDGRCITEQDASTVRANLIASCSDDGIYVNRSATSRILDNTVLDTAGITVRFGESSADVEGNLVDGVIREVDGAAREVDGAAREVDGAALHAKDNVTTSPPWLYLGRHPVRDLFTDAGALDLRWRERPPRRASTSEKDASDLCGRRRGKQPVYGAFDDIAGCAPDASRMRSTSADVERR